jgi:EAL domain-containing protein (putative c-di-GMP-specific phosphodiesterase class I)
VVVSERIGGVDGATHLARRLLASVTEPIDLGHTSVTVGAAIGVAMTIDGPEEPLHLLARADAAMYRAKSQERSAIEIFDASLQRQMVEREDIEHALGEALTDPSGGGLLLHFQPVVDTGSGVVVGVEALVRWNRPGVGFLSPDDFIPVAEATSLIIDLDRWVLAEVGRRLVAWSGDPELADLPVAVNISGRHLLSGQLAGHIAAMLDESGVSPHRLTIEITETVLLGDLIAAGAQLDAVRALGILVALDDFGTGYTSLAHLQHLPIDVIKIDRSFISQINVGRGGALVRMVTDLGHAIDLSIIAEGVETEEELATLRAIGADQLQGYLLSRPLDEIALKTWVNDQALVA